MIINIWCIEIKLGYEIVLVTQLLIINIWCIEIAAGEGGVGIEGIVDY